MARWFVVMACMALFGCRTVLQPPGSPSAAAAARQALPLDFVDGNEVAVVNNGEVFDVLVDEISHATSSVHIIVFIWRPSDPSDRIVKALMERARAGVECRVIVDPFWSRGFEESVKPELESVGCHVQIFRPFSEVMRARELVQRQHRKLVVVDGKRAVTGGFGIWRSWEGNAIGSDEWRDVAVRFRGPVVAQAQRVFEKDWRELTGEDLPRSAYPPLERAGTQRAMFVGSDAGTGGRPSNAQRIHDWLIGTATRRIWIANSYFVPSDRMIDLLREKASSGVDVRVVAPGDTHDMPFVRAAQRDTYPRLTDHDVQIWEYQPAMMHSKTMVVDDRWSVIGSINLDPMSLRQAKECALVVDDATVAAQLADDFRWDLALSIRVRKPPVVPMNGFARILMWFLGAI